MRARLPALAFTAALLVAMSGCLEPDPNTLSEERRTSDSPADDPASPASSEAPSTGSKAPRSSVPKRTEPGPTTAVATSAPGPSTSKSSSPAPDMPDAFGDVRVTPRHASALVDYVLEHPVDALTFKYGPTPAYGQTLAGPSEAGGHQLRIGFLHGATRYFYQLAAEDAGNVLRVAGEFTTDPDPYRWATSNAQVRPGMRISSGNSGCTSAFVLQSWDNETLYLLTAGHCVSGAGAGVNGPGGEVGTVVSSENGGAGRDYALIEIHGSQRDSVSPQMSHFTGPTGVATAKTVRGDDKVCHHGYGIVLGDQPYTRARCGDFGDWSGPEEYGQSFWFYGRGVSGDSGSSALNHRTGEALGIITHIGVGLLGTVNTATPIVWVLELVRSQGFDVALSTAEYTPQPVPLI